MMNDDCITEIRSRRSIRKFKEAELSDEEIEDILKTGISAPSAGNRQPWRIVVVKEKDRKTRLAEAALGQSFVIKAAAIICICAVPEESAERYGDRGRGLYVLQDTSALTQNILLAAHLKGYGACWVGAFKEETVSEILNIPEQMRPVALIPIGRIKGDFPKMRPRKPLKDIVSYEMFREH